MRIIRMTGIALFLAAPLLAGDLDTATIERLTGVKGAWSEKEKVFKVSAPRADLDVRVGGVRVTPPMGLTSWAAFQEMPGGAMVMGDLVLREEQVAPVMDAALGAGLEVTALHNHFLGEQPRILFMHIGGAGDVPTLAAAVGKVFAQMRQPLPAPPPRADIDPAHSTLDGVRIAKILGAPADCGNGVCKVVLGTATRMHGQGVGSAMGVNTWAAFAGSDGMAVVDGDFAMREGELQGVLKALRAAGIEVVAIHSHMAGEEPRILFLHYWGIGRTEDLASGLRKALDTQRR